MKKQKPIFEVEKLRVERDAVILHEVNWLVERGQHWVILGANGSVKTSLLSALTGCLMPSSGEIRIGAARFGAGVPNCICPAGQTTSHGWVCGRSSMVER